MSHDSRKLSSGPSQQSRKDRSASLSSERKQQNQYRSFWSRYQRSSETSSDEGSDSLASYHQHSYDRHHTHQTHISSKDGQGGHWWESGDNDGIVASVTVTGDEASNRSLDNEGPSDEEARPSNLFRRNHRRRTTTNNSHSFLRKQAHSSQEARKSSNNSKSHYNDNGLKSMSSATRRHSPSSVNHAKRGSGIMVASTQQLFESREQRRRELIAHCLYAEAEAMDETKSKRPHSQTLAPPGLYQGHYMGSNHYVGDADSADHDGDGGIVDHDFTEDPEADGVARRRSCFPYFTRPKFFGGSGGSNDAWGGHLGNDTPTGPLEDEEEGYDYDYYFTIGEGNQIVSGKNSSSNRADDKKYTQAGTLRETIGKSRSTQQMPGTEHHPSSAATTTKSAPPFKVVRQSSHLSDSTDTSPLAVNPGICNFDHPDAYCFFPVDDHSDDDDNGHDDHHHQNHGDIPLCNWNDIQFFSSACARQLASLEVAREIQTQFQENSQTFQQQYLEMTEVTNNECAEISPRDALEDLVPQELLSMFLDSCHIDGPSTKGTGATTNTNSSNTNCTGSLCRDNAGACRHQGVTSNREWTAQTTAHVVTRDEFHY